MLSTKDLNLKEKPYLTIGKLKSLIKDIPNDALVLMQRVEDSYFSERELGPHTLSPLSTLKIKNYSNWCHEDFIQKAKHDIELFKKGAGNYDRMEMKMSYPNLEMLEKNLKIEIETPIELLRDEYFEPESGFYEKEFITILNSGL